MFEKFQLEYDGDIVRVIFSDMRFTTSGEFSVAVNDSESTVGCVTFWARQISNIPIVQKTLRLATDKDQYITIADKKFDAENGYGWIDFQIVTHTKSHIDYMDCAEKLVLKESGSKGFQYRYHFCIRMDLRHNDDELISTALSFPVSSDNVTDGHSNFIRDMQDLIHPVVAKKIREDWAELNHVTLPDGTTLSKSDIVRMLEDGNYFADGTKVVPRRDMTSSEILESILIQSKKAWDNCGKGELG